MNIIPTETLGHNYKRKAVVARAEWLMQNRNLWKHGNDFLFEKLVEAGLYSPRSNRKDCSWTIENLKKYIRQGKYIESNIETTRDRIGESRNEGEERSPSGAL
jgi:hypothetical protein